MMGTHSEECNDIDQEVVEVDLEYLNTDKRSYITKWKRSRVVVLAIAFVFIIGVLVVASTVSLIVFSNEKSEKIMKPPAYFTENDIINSIEFQISLRPHEAWTYRNNMIDEWIKAMNENSEFLFLNKQNATEDIYFEYHIAYQSDKICGIHEDYKIRSRTYHSNKATTIDIKGGEEEHSKEDSCNLPFWPNEKYYNVSRQKCEEDVHPCFSKFTRATSVVFSGIDKPLNTCQDLVDTFPGVFNNVNETNKANQIRYKNPEHWYRLKWTGIAGASTHYEVQFTIQYEASFLEIMDDELPIIAGEWSLRFWSDNGAKWELDVVDDFETLFYQLTLMFDKDDVEHVECANEFFNGGESRGIKFDEHQDFL